MFLKFISIATLLLITFTHSNAEQKSTPIKSVAVFCSADDKIPEHFKKVAFRLGKKIASSDYGLVTGGSKTGLMKQVVDGYMVGEKSSNLYGVIPNTLKEYNIHHDKIPEKNIIWTETMHNRLKTFHDKADVVVVLPGGFGTLHELMDFLVHNQFGILKKDIILFNIDGFWDNLIEQFKVMIKLNALSKKHFDNLKIVSNLDECLEQINKSNNVAAHEGLKDRYWETEKK